MKKIAIITWIFHNYGTVLQAFALNYYINSIKERQCKLINYDLNKTHLDLTKKWSLKIICNKIFKRTHLLLLKSICNYYQLKYSSDINRKEKGFISFLQNIPQTQYMHKKELPNLNNEFDYFICGSDQIWNPAFFDQSYFLNFVKKDKVKIAYAPSIGGKNIPSQLQDQYHLNLQHFNYISTREESNIKILEKISKKKVFPVIDPTLLIDHSEWNNIIKDLNSSSITNKENYIFCYFLSNNNWYNKVISSLNPQKKYIIFSVGTSAPYSYKVKNATIIHPTPIEFIAYINHAKYIITDSFHGTIFAINFNKNFIALKRNNDTDKNSENQRFYSLLQKLNLLDYFLGKNEQYDINKIKAIDYNLINLKLNLLREQSINFLNQSLKDSKHE